MSQLIESNIHYNPSIAPDIDEIEPISTLTYLYRQNLDISKKKITKKNQVDLSYSKLSNSQNKIDNSMSLIDFQLSRVLDKDKENFRNRAS